MSGRKFEIEIHKKIEDKIRFTPEEKIARREHYFMLLTSANTIMYSIAQIGTSTLNNEHRRIFKDTHRQCRYLLDNIFTKASNNLDIQVLQDISFTNVAAATTVFGLVSKMAPEQVDWFLDEVIKLSYAAYNRQHAQEIIANNPG